MRRETGEEKIRSDLRKSIDDNVDRRKATGEKLIDQDPKRPALDEKTSCNLGAKKKSERCSLTKQEDRTLNKWQEENDEKKEKKEKQRFALRASPGKKVH